jgi:lipopolysaccharide transport protein LptA
VWQAGQLTMPQGFQARTTDGAATLRAAKLTWHAAAARLVASGSVEATRNGGRLRAQTLRADTRVRRVSANGGAPASGRPARASYTFGEWKIEYDTFNADLAADPIPFEATGNVVLTGPGGTITAPRVDGRATPKLDLLNVRAHGGVTLKTVEKGGRAITAESREATYEPSKEQVRLEGAARASVTAPILAAPARLAGEQVVIDLETRSAVVSAAPGARVEVEAHLKRDPEPVRLNAERVRYDGTADRITAEGRPLIRDPRGTLSSDRMEVNLAEESNNIMVARAIGNVVVDASFAEPRPQAFHATAREATYVRAEDRISLSGDVQGTVTSPATPKPATFGGQELTFDLKTRKISMSGQPARAQFVPPRPSRPAAGDPRK